MKISTRLFILPIALAIFCCLAPLGAQTTDKLPQPILISSAGQSADVAIAGMLCKKLNLQAKAEALAKNSNLEGVKTLMMVAGFSSKGLGAAGVSREQEQARIQALLSAAREKGIRIITLHLGGKARRGAQSDEFNKLAAESSERLIVVRQGDEDRFFSNIAAEKKIPIDLVDRISDIMQPLGKLF
jgi:hypothetical protein